MRNRHDIRGTNTSFSLTPNEERAALVLVQSCLDGMGGQRPIDLDDDPFTWVWPDVLIDNGWTRHETAGTWNALLDKGIIYEYDENDYVLSDDAYLWLDTIWKEEHV